MSFCEKSASNVIPKFDCYSDPATLGPRWKRWLTSFELFVDGKGLIITETTNANTRQQRRAMLLHLAGPEVQEIFSTLADTGEATDYSAAVTALNGYFLLKANVLHRKSTQFRVFHVYSLSTKHKMFSSQISFARFSSTWFFAYVIRHLRECRMPFRPRNSGQRRRGEGKDQSICRQSSKCETIRYYSR